MFELTQEFFQNGKPVCPESKNSVGIFTRKEMYERLNLKFDDNDSGVALLKRSMLQQYFKVCVRDTEMDMLDFCKVFSVIISFTE